MCGGFQWSRNSLILINIFYIITGVYLIYSGASSISSNKLSSLPIVGGVVACGVFLLLISILGIYGTLKHHQVILFFYMVILFILFIIQFSIACACLAVSKETQARIARQGWSTVSIDVKNDVQTSYSCCGFEDQSLNWTNVMGHPSCYKIPECSSNCIQESTCCFGGNTVCGCDPCVATLHEVIDRAFRVSGEVSLFFSFTQIIGAILARRYRNIYNPRGASTLA